MQNNLGTILGGIALVVSLGNSYFIYDMSKGKSDATEEVSTNGTDPNAQNAGIQNNAPMQQPGAMDPMAQQQQSPYPVKDAKAAPPAPTGPPTTIKFKKMEHDFGNVRQESENTYEFVFTNTGKNPLVITDAQGSCGCTVPEYPKEPIAPGASNKIKVVYKPGKQEGEQNKNVTITANTEPQQTIITIKAKVNK